MRCLLSIARMLLLTLLWSSCMPDNCREHICQNGGVCVAGNCSCLNGYEGLHCSEIWNERFLGTWTSTDTRQGDTTATLQYPVTVIGKDRTDEFFIMNLGNGLDHVLCKRKSYLQFVITEIHQIDSAVITISGEGLLDTLTHTITGAYMIQYPDTMLGYTIFWSK